MQPKPKELRTASTSQPLIAASAHYPGDGTQESPYIVSWYLGDPDDPYNWSRTYKWLITIQLAVGTMIVTFASSSYTGSLEQTKADLHMSHTEAVLPITLYVLGFGLGPLVFAPLSEIYGRRVVMLGTFVPFTLWNIICAVAPNTPVLLIFRLLAGIFGSSPLAIAGGGVADIWRPTERAVPSSIFSSGPWFGPIFGPLVGGCLMKSQLGWRFNFWIVTIASAVLNLLNFFTLPETYAPVLLRRRAQSLQTRPENAGFHLSKHDVDRNTSVKHVLTVNLQRPFIFLFREPIVTCFAIYIALVYAVLYANFIAYPIVFQKHRGWSAGKSGLVFLSIGIGILIANCFAPWVDRLYIQRAAKSRTGRAPPETRLIPGMIGSCLITVGCFWFAWTTFPSIHWAASVTSGIPFGCGLLLVFQSVVAYLMDTYLHLCASAVAATIVLRSILAATFPLFTDQMFSKLGDQWGASVFAFLALICTPLPFLFYTFGSQIRAKSHFASQLSGSDAQKNGAISV